MNLIQKVGLWRTTNDSLRSQIEQLKGHVTQSQEQVGIPSARKRRTKSARFVKSWPNGKTRIKTDTDEFDRTYSLERDNLVDLVHKQEKALQDTTAELAAPPGRDR